jgi:hypothetical protein
MTVRQFDFLDFPTLARYRHDVLTLDSARALTRGNPLGAAALLSYLNPRRYIFTAVASENGEALIGQVTLTETEASARLTFLAPEDGPEALTVPLVENLAAQAGEWGAFHILAEVDEHSPAFQSLRQAGFSMYAWQRIWKLPAAEDRSAERLWQPVREVDWPAVQSLHNQIVPALLQPIEMLPRAAEGLVCREGSELQAYVRVSKGPAGIWLQPHIPPDCDCTPRLAGMLGTIGNGRRPVYVCVRSYHAWLEAVLNDLGAQPGPQQAVMVKRLVQMQKAEQAVKAMEKVLAKPAAPVARVAASEDPLLKK